MAPLVTEKPVVEEHKIEEKVTEEVKDNDFDKDGNFIGKKDDLTKVEGIGPKVQEHLNNAGIFTWAQLSRTESDKIKTILEPHGAVYQRMNPGTWPEQAKMAHEGRWDELEKWQDELDGGV